jgi:hypothetical protein
MVVLAILLAGPVPAQQTIAPTTACGGTGADSSWIASVLGSAEEIFAGADTDDVKMRAAIQVTKTKLGSGRIVTDTMVCAAIRAAVRPQLSHLFKPAIPLENFAPLYLQFEEYYAVVLLPSPAAMKRQINGYAAMLIFRVKGLEYLNVVLL